MIITGKIIRQGNAGYKKIYIKKEKLKVINNNQKSRKTEYR